jgi:protein gp37
VSATTTIEWTERTWNPVTGCDRVSPGCDHCYALTLAARLKAMGNRRYQQDGHPVTSGPGFGLTLHRDLVDAPRHWRKPAVVFVNSMSDLFHERIPFEFLSAVFDTMVTTPQHTYQILTKRATHLTRVAPRLPWPANVWMGVTVEDQVQVERRARRLLQVPAAIRFLSCEPLIGPVDLSGVLCECAHLNGADQRNLPDPAKLWRCVECGAVHPQERPYGTHSLHWVIAGGESGPGARPCETAWLRSLRDQCQAAGVAFFLKQLGGHPDKRGHDKALLDGRPWREMPERGT